MQIDEFIEAHRADLGKKAAKYERKFAEEVLANVSGLDLGDVATQTHFRDLEGKRRAIDFTISEGPHVRIAIEVDGWDKTGRGAGMTRSEFHDWSAREIAIVAQGWSLLRFANSLLNNYPEQCIRAIELRLQAEREVAARLQASEESQDAVAKAVGALEAELRETGRQLSEAERELDDARAARLSNRLGEIAAERSAAVSGVMSAGDQDEMEQLAVRRRSALAKLERELTDTIADRDDQIQENKRMKTVAVAFAAALVAIAVIVLVASGGGDDGEPDQAQVQSNVNAPSADDSGSGGSGEASTQPTPSAPARCQEAIGWQEARGEVGSDAVVRGPVVGAVFAESTNASPTYLNLGKDFPSEKRFTIVIFGDDRKNFRGAPEDAYEGKDVAVEGEISEFNGIPQIIANHRNDIAVC